MAGHTCGAALKKKGSIATVPVQRRLHQLPGLHERGDQRHQPVGAQGVADALLTNVGWPPSSLDAPQKRLPPPVIVPAPRILPLGGAAT